MNDRKIETEHPPTKKSSVKLTKELYNIKNSIPSAQPFSPHDIALTGTVDANQLVEIANAKNLLKITQTNSINPNELKKITDLELGSNTRAELMVTKYTEKQIKLAALTQILLGASSGVDQSQLGDCWFETSLASVAKSYQGQLSIANMINKNKDGSYTVTFPGAKQNPINVTDKEIKDYALTNSAKWADIIEAAMIKLKPNDINLGGLTQNGIQLLTGKDSLGLILTPNAHKTYLTNLSTFINNTIKLGEPLAADVQVTTNNGTFSHAFAIEAYDPKNDTITVRNPWGINLAGNIVNVGKINLPEVGQTINGVSNLGNGVLSMPLTTFNDNFTALYFITPNKKNMQILNNITEAEN